MSASSKYWADAASASPGSQLAAMQAKLYESETLERLMDKFDARISTLTTGITDATELQAAEQLAEALLAEKRAIAQSFATNTAAQTRTAVVKLVIKAGIRPDHDTVRLSSGLMAQRSILTLMMLTLIIMQSVTLTANAQVIRHPGKQPGIFSGGK